MLAAKSTVCLRSSLEIVRARSAGPVRVQELEPFRLGLCVLGGDDLHLVSGLDHMVKAHQFLVHLCRNGLVANLRMDEVRKVKGRGALLDGALLSAWG